MAYKKASETEYRRYKQRNRTEYWKLYYAKNKDKIKRKNSTFRTEFKEICKLYNRRDYLKRKHKLPWKIVQKYLDKLLKDMEIVKNMTGPDLTYWSMIKPHIDFCSISVEQWRKESNNLEGNSESNGTTQTMEELPKNARV